MLHFLLESVAFMNILFIIDKIELKYFEFNNLVTNFWLIKEFLNRGFDVSITTEEKLSVINSKANTALIQL